MKVDGGLRSIFQLYLPKFFWQAVETGGTGLGVPDLYFCHKKKSGWIECKKTEANAVGIDPEQVAWAEHHHRNGGRSFLAVRRFHRQSARKPARNELHLFSAMGIRHCKIGGISNVPTEFTLGSWSGDQSRWDWDAIARILMRSS